MTRSITLSLIILILLVAGCGKSALDPVPPDQGREAVLSAAHAFLETHGTTRPVHPGTNMNHSEAQQYLAWLLTDWTLPAACTIFDALWLPLCDESLVLEVMWVLETGDGGRLMRWDVPKEAAVTIPCP